jgi:hypothetical protein
MMMQIQNNLQKVKTTEAHISNINKTISVQNQSATSQIAHEGQIGDTSAMDQN